MPWDYAKIVKSYLDDTKKMMDYDTGGAEFLLSLNHPYNMTAATEGYPPNVELCKERLLPLGVNFKECSDASSIPFEDESFDIMINRHGDFVPELCTDGMQKFLDSRSGDIRINLVHSTAELKCGNLFYITCIDKPEKLQGFYDKYKERFHCVYQRDIYTKEQWLELLQCEKLVVFGDGKNDMDMFELADECYAVANAHEDLKKIATDDILSNDEDGVARWLEGRCFNFDKSSNL